MAKMQRPRSSRSSPSPFFPMTRCGGCARPAPARTSRPPGTRRSSCCYPTWAPVGRSWPGLRVDNLDFEHDVARVIDKPRRIPVVPLVLVADRRARPGWARDGPHVDRWFDQGGSIQGVRPGGLGLGLPPELGTPACRRHCDPGLQRLPGLVLVNEGPHRLAQLRREVFNWSAETCGGWAR